MDGQDGFTVDADGVRAFGTALQSSLDKGLAPGGDGITASFRRGVCFGEGSDSAAVQQAAWAYHAQLERSVALMETFVHNAAVMIAAATEIADAYETADAMSGEDMRAVLDRATAKVDEPARLEARFEREFGLH